MPRRIAEQPSATPSPARALSAHEINARVLTDVRLSMAARLAYVIIKSLSRDGVHTGTTDAQIAARLGVGPHAVGPLLAELQRAGYATSSRGVDPDGAERRAVTLIDEPLPPSPSAGAAAVVAVQIKAAIDRAKEAREQERREERSLEGEPAAYTEARGQNRPSRGGPHAFGRLGRTMDWLRGKAGLNRGEPPRFETPGLSIGEDGRGGFVVRCGDPSHEAHAIDSELAYYLYGLISHTPHGVTFVTLQRELKPHLDGENETRLRKRMPQCISDLVHKEQGYRLSFAIFEGPIL